MSPSLASLLACLSVAAEPEGPRLDRHGDPLPPSAVQRLGTVRFRRSWGDYRPIFSPDGKFVATSTIPRIGPDRDLALRGHDVFLWDAATGRPVRSWPNGPCVLAWSFLPDRSREWLQNVECRVINSSAIILKQRKGFPAIPPVLFEFP